MFNVRLNNAHRNKTDSSLLCYKTNLNIQPLLGNRNIHMDIYLYLKNTQVYKSRCIGIAIPFETVK